MKKNEPTTYPVIIDYANTFEQHVAAGKYDQQGLDITEQNFPIQGDGQVKLKPELVECDPAMSTDDVLVNIDARGYRPAKVAEILAFGAAYPEVQRDFCIVALGSISQYKSGGGYTIVCLHMNGDQRSLDKVWIRYNWSSEYRLLIVPKQS